MRILAALPYFGGDSSAAHSKKENRLGYLRLCYDSLLQDKVVPIVACMPEDVEAVEKVIGTFTRPLVVMPEDPVHLCYEVALAIQRMNMGNYTHILFSESDQEYPCRLADIVINNLNEGDVLTPLRWEHARGNHHDFTWLGGRYCLSTAGNNGWMRIFGGAFLCSADIFMRTTFKAVDELPVEEITGRGIIQQHGARQANPFFTIHHSGREVYER